MEPTLPFPNRVLKRLSADNTDWATDWDDRSRPELNAFFVPIYQFFDPLAQGIFLYILIIRNIKYDKYMETLTIVPAEVATQSSEKKVTFVESFKEPFTPQAELATKYAGSGDPVGSNVPSNGELDRPYSERRLEELAKVYAGLLLKTHNRK